MVEHQVKKLREEKGMTQKELAEQLGVSVFYMNRVENGRLKLNAKLAIRIANVLECSLDDIFLR